MSEEKKGTKCPVCSVNTLKKGEKMIYCSEYKPRKDGSDWYNDGSCDFRITFKNKLVGRDLTPQDIRKLLNGEKLRTKDGDRFHLDIDQDSFLFFDWKDKPEDEDF